MDATTLLANTLSPGTFFFSFFLWERRGGEGRGGEGGKNGLLKEFFSPCLDANTRQDATQKLETASRENYVCLLPLLLH